MNLPSLAPIFWTCLAIGIATYAFTWGRRWGRGRVEEEASLLETLDTQLVYEIPGNNEDYFACTSVSVVDYTALQRSLHSAPLHTVQELFACRYSESTSAYFSSYDGCMSCTSGPRLLVCHDMKGGYLQDRFDNGGAFEDAYQIFHWNTVDVFIYFSHTLVTIPPRTWIAACRHNGALALGTFITEWEQGRLYCADLFATPEKAQQAAECLAKLCVDYSFDGWLINLENTMEPSWVPNATLFLAKLTEQVRKLRAPFTTLVVCYDSVTVEGDLSWQDTVNDRNVCFFNACDGVFTNYCWKEQSPKECAEYVGVRKAEVYMGIDAWGRNTYGGGRYDCKVALDAISPAGLSAALFAPGWTWEHELNFQSRGAPSDDLVQAQATFFAVQREFEQIQERFWGPIVATCNDWSTHANTVNFSTHATSPLRPFRTNFSQGVGYSVYRAGMSVHRTAPFYNLTFQERSVMFTHDSLQVTRDYSCAFDGCSCVHIEGHVQTSSAVDMHMRMHEAFNADKTYVVRLVVCCKSGFDIHLKLEFDSNTPSAQFAVLTNALDDSREETPIYSKCIALAHDTRSWAPTSRRLVGDAADKIWEERTYVLPRGVVSSSVHSAQLLCICTGVGTDPQEQEFSALLGAVAIGTPEQIAIFPPVSCAVRSLQLRRALAAFETQSQFVALTLYADVDLLVRWGIDTNLERWLCCRTYCWDLHQLLLPHTDEELSVSCAQIDPSLSSYVEQEEQELHARVLTESESETVCKYLRRQLEPNASDAHVLEEFGCFLGRTYDSQLRMELQISELSAPLVLVLVPSEAGFTQPPLQQCVFVAVHVHLHASTASE